jgi:hypothetical protein
MAIFPARYTLRRYLLYGLVCYVLALIAERFDHELYALTKAAVSGHTVKHLLAALAALWVLLMLRRRASV